MSRSTLAIFTAAIVLAAAGAVGLYVWLPASTPPSPAAATVNGTVITQREVDGRVAELLPTLSFHANMAPEKMRALRRTALEELALDELIVQEARGMGLTPDEQAVDTALAAVRGRFTTEKAFEAALASSQLSKRELRRQLERAELVRDARKAHAPADPTREDVRAYYDANPGKFLRPEQVRIVELLVKVDPAGGQSAAAAGEKKARGLAARARKGEDLGALAREHSDDDWRVKDGDLGWVHKGRLDPDLEASAFSAPDGEVRVVRSLSGFHVFRVTGRQPATQLSFADAAPIIADRLRTQRRGAAETAWTATLQSGATIAIVDPALRNVTPLEVPRLNVNPRQAATRGVAPSRSH
jgi:parvulin-like peptidyl-prolyl isomerase